MNLFHWSEEIRTQFERLKKWQAVVGWEAPKYDCLYGDELHDKI